MYPSSRTERLGAAAGAVVTLMLLGLLFAGPWRVFAVETGDTFPIRALEETHGNPFVVGMVGILFVAFVTGTAYPHVVAGREEDHGWDDLAMSIFVPPLAAVLVGFLALLLVPAGESLLAGAVVDAATQAAVGVLVAVFFVGVVGTGLAVVVGVPALAGVYVGVLLGRASVPD